MALQGSPTTRDHIGNALEANLRKAYILTMHGYQSRAKYNRIYNVNPSRIKIERDAVYSGYGTFDAKAEGAAINFDSGQEAWTKTYTHVEYAKGVQVTRTAIADDLHGVIRQLIALGNGPLAQAARYTKEVKAMTLFNDTLTSGTVYTAEGTNYSLLSTTHFLVTGGTWSNKPANSMDLSQEALEFAIGHWLANQVNQRGQVICNGPDRLICGPADWAIGKRLVGTRGRRPQGGANADINPMDEFGLELCVPELLTNDGRWLLLAPKEETGLNYFTREEPNISRLPDADNGNLRMYAHYRDVFGATHVHGTWGSD